LLLIALSNTKLCNQNDEFTAEEKRQTHTEGHTDVAVKFVCGRDSETQRKGFDGGRKGDEEVL
jgi:hypothetical protein